MGPNGVIKRRAWCIVLMIFRFLATSFAIRRSFDPTGAGDTFAGFAGFITQRKTYHSEKHENAYLWLKFSFVSRNLGQKE
jgi:sugar/nucleoside kinase (ribokinase family)